MITSRIRLNCCICLNRLYFIFQFINNLFGTDDIRSDCPRYYLSVILKLNLHKLKLCETILFIIVVVDAVAQDL